MHSEYESRLLGSPSKENSKTPKGIRSPPKDTYSDRFIPSRTSTNLNVRKNLFGTSTLNSPENIPAYETISQGSDQPINQRGLGLNIIKYLDIHTAATYSYLLQAELGLNPNSSVPLSSQLTPSKEVQPTFSPSTSPQKGGNVLKFRTPKSSEREESPFSLSPISEGSQKFLIRSQSKLPRKIAKAPFKILEAPSLQDDFYLNLVEWSSSNIIAVGLSNSVFLYNAGSGQVSRVCELLGEPNRVTSVAWSNDGTLLSVGTREGRIMVFDISQDRKIHEFPGHSHRVGALAWNGNILVSGSRDHKILLRDLRQDAFHTIKKLKSHKQEVCGLKFSYNGTHLASGGNDNTLLVWDINSLQKPLHTFTQHVAAVKAIAWSPHQNSLLVSGGGTQDRCIRFWNVSNGNMLSCHDTGSQVCNLAWSKNSNEIVSTHGYSQNQVAVWSYEGMQPLASLTGHTTRVLYLSMSPDGQTIVTGAGDETLRFWNILPGPKSNGISRGLEFFQMNEIR